MQEKLLDKSLKPLIEKLMLKNREESEAKTDDLDGLWLLIAIGAVLPLFVLAIEVISHKCSTACPLRLKDLRFYLAQIHLQSLHSRIKFCKKITDVNTCTCTYCYLIL